MKFSQLIENNLRNILLEESCKNVVKKLFPDSFLKTQNWAYIWINILKFYVLYILFLLFAKLRTIESDWNYAADQLHLHQIKLF